MQNEEHKSVPGTFSNLHIQGDSTSMRKKDIAVFFSGFVVAGVLVMMIRVPAMIEAINELSKPKKVWYEMVKDVRIDEICYPPGDPTFKGVVEKGSKFYVGGRKGRVYYLHFSVLVFEDEFNEIATPSTSPNRSRWGEPNGPSSNPG